MLLGLACVAGTSLCYGIGSVLQGLAAKGTDAGARLDPRLLLRLLAARYYVAGLSLDTAGFFLSLVALRSLPLYMVQSVVASSLAVTAVSSALVLAVPMSRGEGVALVVVVLGLGLVGLSAAAEPAVPLRTGIQVVLVGASCALGLLAIPLARLRGRSSAWALGGVAGVEFGVVAVAARALLSATGGDLGDLPGHLLASPATYAVLVAAPVALMAYATALQRGSVVQATAPMVVGETVLPALVGLAFLGDHARPGWGVLATVGFVVAVGAALALSRFGEVSS